MIVAGLDVGSMTSKAVIMEDGIVLGKSIISSSEEGAIQALHSLNDALAEAGLKKEELGHIEVTGAGRKDISFADKNRTTQSSLAKGGYNRFPSARLIIDVGAEHCTLVKLNKSGRLDDSSSNDHCASGTGVFIETMAKLMQMPLEEFVEQSLDAKEYAEVSSMCAVFAEQEVISHVHRDPPTPKNDVIAGIHASIASRIVSFAKRLGVEEDVILTGGVARNTGFARILEELLGAKIMIPEEPELIPALGAALYAQNRKPKQK